MENTLQKNIKKRFTRHLIILMLIVVGFGVYYINSLLPIITGYPAKYLCSAVFVSNRVQEEVEAMDLHFSFIKYTKNVVDYQDSSVTSSFLWGKSKAIFRKGFGATLIRDVEEKELRKIKFPRTPELNYNPDTTAWPLGNVIPDTSTNINTEKLDLISDKLMGPDGYNGHAFAFIVLHKGIPVVERYQPEFTSQTRFLSWSMAKSFTNTLTGILVHQGKIDIHQPVDIPEWKDDERSKITISDLMQMQSGLNWNEDYGNRSDVTMMLYCQNNFSEYASDRTLSSPTGSLWYYSSGSTNIVSKLIRNTINDDQHYYQFSKTELFNKIGMPDALIEVDPSGTQVGSSYVFATARDYARYGLFNLQDGVFIGERILPEGWVKYSTTPANNSKGEYGAFFWLNKSNYYPSAPEDMFSCNGYDGQRIFMIPSKELVVVILGFSHKPDHVMDLDALLGDIIGAIN